MLRIAKIGLTIFFLTILGNVGCGDDDDDDDERDGGASVTSVELEDGVIALGTSEVMSVEFSFSSDDVFDDDRNVAVAVALPPQVRFQDGSAELSRPIDDRDVEPEVIVCGDGSSLLLFDFDENELFDVENPDGNADAELTLTIDAVETSGPETISAAAGNDAVVASCNSFIGQAAVVFTVI